MTEATSIRPGQAMARPGSDEASADAILRWLGADSDAHTGAPSVPPPQWEGPEANGQLADDVTPDGVAPEAKVAAPQPPQRRRLSGAMAASVAFALVLVGVDGVIEAESWRGLAGFGRMIGIAGIAAQGVPVTLDGVSIISALLALRAELDGESSGMYRAALYTFTLASSAANWWHGVHSGGLGGALYLGGMSIAVTFVFDMLLRQLRRKDRRRAGLMTDPLPKFGIAHWIRYPGLTFRAWSVSIRDGHTSPRGAIDAAKAADVPVLPIDAETLTAMSVRDRLAAAFGAIGKTDVPTAVAMLRESGAAVDQSHAYQVRRAMLEGGTS